MKQRSGAWALAAVVWALVIVAFGIVPVQPLINATAPDQEVASTVVGHFVEYFVLAALIAAAWGGRSGKARAAALALTLAVGLGAVIELMQAFLPYRDRQAIDVLVNAAGAACGVAVFSVVSVVVARRRSRLS